MKFNPSESTLLQLISKAGGSVCLGVDTSIPRAAHKALRKMVTRGDLMVEDTDDGPRFSLTVQGQEEANG